MFGDILIEEIWPMSTILPCWIDRAYIRDWRACLYVNGLSLALLGQSNLVFFRFKSQYYFDLDWQLFHLIWLNIVNTVNDEFILLKPHCTAYVSPFIVQFRLACLNSLQKYPWTIDLPKMCPFCLVISIWCLPHSQLISRITAPHCKVTSTMMQYAVLFQEFKEALKGSRNPINLC